MHVFQLEPTHSLYDSQLCDNSGYESLLAQLSDHSHVTSRDSLLSVCHALIGI
jgi:hypothetical protein